MGVSSKGSGPCETCGGRVEQCAGHFGRIVLPLPVFHIGYFRRVVQLLQCICKSCGRVLVNDEEKTRLSRRLRQAAKSAGPARPGGHDGWPLPDPATFSDLGDVLGPLTTAAWDPTDPTGDGARASLGTTAPGRSAGPSSANDAGERKTRESVFKAVLDRAKRCRTCPWCGQQNGPVKKCPGSLKILHDRFGKTPSEAANERRGQFRDAAEANPDLVPLLRGLVELLDPLKVLELFRRVPDADLPALDLGGRPEHLLVTDVAVPPICIRPSVEVEGGASNEDDLTVKLMNIVELSGAIESGLGGVQAKSVAEWWDSLQVECATLINAELPGVPAGNGGPGGGGKRPRGLVQRLKGKQGRFRGNLSGKRVDFTGRTVISPDPNVDVDEVVVPTAMATTLTFPERVTPHNIERLRTAIRNGTRRWPGARFLVSAPRDLDSGEPIEDPAAPPSRPKPPAGGGGLGTDPVRSYLQYGDRRALARDLRPGDVVERHLVDGDVVLFNRQPSLHRVSLLAFRARVLPGRTLRFNECVCAPFNADFDGDEMNIHVPQTEESRAEALALSGVLANLRVPRGGEILVGATQDFVTAAWLLTERDQLFSRSEFAQLAAAATDGAATLAWLPEPAVLKPAERWTGKQLMGFLLSPSGGRGGWAPASPELSGWAQPPLGAGGRGGADEDAAMRAQELAGGGDGGGCGGRSRDDWARAADENAAERCRRAGFDPPPSDGGLGRARRSKVAALCAPGMHLAVRERGGGCRCSDAETGRALAADEVHNCPDDGLVLILGSEVICGRLGKTTLGGGGKTGLFSALIQDASPAHSAAVMGRLSRLAARFLSERGFSIGVADVRPSVSLMETKREAIRREYAKCEELIEQFRVGKLEADAGCDASATLENRVLGILNGVRSLCADHCLRELPRDNGPLIQAQSGAKGSPINICQMVACVGQQSIGGRRAPDGFGAGRSLPHFPTDDRSPEGKGFVATSYFEGLSPTEFFFHAAAGREGLVDTAVKTAETGYMSRRLIKALEDLCVAYDGTVRASNGAISQFRYGDDGLDPVEAEADGGQPLDLARAWRVVPGPGRGPDVMNSRDDQDEEEAALLVGAARRAAVDALREAGLMAPSPAGGDALGGSGGGGGGALGEDMDERTADDAEEDDPCDPEDHASPSPRCRDSVRASLAARVGDIARVRERLGLPADRADACRPELEALAAQTAGLCRRQIRAWCRRVATKIATCRVDPGSTVGATGAQSIGEPGTQMTLKTFHFAGVAAMNVTLGVPRIKEIINASQTISTPVLTVELENPESEAAARLVKARLEGTQLQAVAESIKIVEDPSMPYLTIKLDRARLNNLGLDLTADDVRQSLAGSKLRCRAEMIELRGRDTLWVRPDDLAGRRFGIGAAAAAEANERKGRSLLPHLEDLKAGLPCLVVSGVPGVERAVVVGQQQQDGGPGGGGKGGGGGPAEAKSEAEGRRFQVVAQGVGLRDALGLEGVRASGTRSNHVAEAYAALGIEAARATICREIQATMAGHGMVVDWRHITLLADCMTGRGEVLGITRFGMARMKDSFLMLASFEKTTDHLFDAALRGRRDRIEGVSECIVMGVQAPVGTGMFRVFQEAEEERETAGEEAEEEGWERGWPRRDPPLFFCS